MERVINNEGKSSDNDANYPLSLVLAVMETLYWLCRIFIKCLKQPGQKLRVDVALACCEAWMGWGIWCSSGKLPH